MYDKHWTLNSMPTTALSGRIVLAKQLFDPASTVTTMGVSSELFNTIASYLA